MYSDHLHRQLAASYRDDRLRGTARATLVREAVAGRPGPSRSLRPLPWRGRRLRVDVVSAAARLLP